MVSGLPSVGGGGLSWQMGGLSLAPNDSQPHNDLPQLRQVSTLKANILLLPWASREERAGGENPAPEGLGAQGGAAVVERVVRSEGKAASSCLP